MSDLFENIDKTSSDAIEDLNSSVNSSASLLLNSINSLCEEAIEELNPSKIKLDSRNVLSNIINVCNDAIEDLDNLEIYPIHESKNTTISEESILQKNSFILPIEKVPIVIGTGGEDIMNIVAETGAKIGITDAGEVTIEAIDMQAILYAKNMITDLIRTPEIGKEYTGEVTKVLSFGAFVKFLPNHEGLVHTSKFPRRVRNLSKIIKVGQIIPVKVDRFDNIRDRTDLSLAQPEDFVQICEKQAELEKTEKRRQDARRLPRHHLYRTRTRRKPPNYVTTDKKDLISNNPVDRFKVNTDE